MPEINDDRPIFFYLVECAKDLVREKYTEVKAPLQALPKLFDLYNSITELYGRPYVELEVREGRKAWRVEKKENIDISLRIIVDGCKLEPYEGSVVDHLLLYNGRDELSVVCRNTPFFREKARKRLLNPHHYLSKFKRTPFSSLPSHLKNCRPFFTKPKLGISKGISQRHLLSVWKYFIV